MMLMTIRKIGRLLNLFSGPVRTTESELIESGSHPNPVSFDRHALADLLGLSPNERRELRDNAFVDDDIIAGMLMNAVGNGKGFFYFYFELANTLLSAGYPEWARTYFERILEILDDPAVHSSYLAALLLSPSETSESMFAAHLRWAQRFEGGIEEGRIYPNSTEPDRILKVGYLCHFFSGTVIESGFYSVLESQDPNQLVNYLYSDGPIPEKHAELSCIWRDTANLSDKQLSQMIQEDEIDVLVEMNGHSQSNRLRVMPLKPAPVQVILPNHNATSGLKSIDYILTDRVSLIDQELEYFTERPCRNDRFLCAMDFHRKDFGPVAPPPSIRNGYVTFGYFGSTHKVNGPTVELWARVMNEVPDSRFILKAASMDHDFFRKNFIAFFERNGIERERLELRGVSPFEEMLAQYADVDIALDSVPHTGGATMLCSLWQGVPTISLTGDRLASRGGHALLEAADLLEFSVKTADEFIERAVALARDTERRRALRDTMRGHITKSHLCDIERSARNFEDRYREMWRQWCSEQA